MKIGFIGAGKVGFSLGKYLVDHGKCVVGYYSRSIDSAREAANFTETQYFDTPQELVHRCDMVFLTVPDGCIERVYEALASMDIAGKCLIHCSGALTSDVFADIDSRGARGYSVHPLCAVSGKYTGYKELADTYFTVEGDDVADIVELFTSCGNNIQPITKEHKVKYHAAAVCASNLVVGLYDMATKLLMDCGLDEQFASHGLESLFAGNARNIIDKGTTEALTGPVERADSTTVQKHLDTLDGSDREIYRQLSRYLTTVAARKNPQRDYGGLEHILEEGNRS